MLLVLGLVNLRELHVNDNNITRLSADGFSDLKNLSLLRLANNKISSLQRNYFKGLRRIKQIDLRSNNVITNTDKHIFQELSLLESIDLYPHSYAGLGTLNLQGLNYFRF